MKLNLHIISGEPFFAAWNAQFADAANVRNLLAPQVVEDSEQELNPEFVYIVEPGQLEKMSKTNQRISVIYSGPLPEKMPSNWNVLYTAEPVTLSLLINELTRTFTKYHTFESRLRQVIEENLPISEFGPICFEMLNNPVIMVGLSFQILFLYCPKPDRGSTQCLRDYYKKYNFTGEYVDMFEINLLSFDQEFIEIADQAGLTLYSSRGGDGIRALFYNVTVGNAQACRFVVDEVIHEFTERDESVVDFLGEFFKKNLSTANLERMYEKHQSNQVLLQQLLESPVSQDALKSQQQEFGWNDQDEYFCLLMQSKSKFSYSQLLDSQAVYLSLFLPCRTYCNYKNKLLFLFNLTQANISKQEIVILAKSLLQDNLLVAGCSSSFTDLLKLRYYCREAETALTIGLKRSPDDCFFEYDDYLLDYLLEKIRENEIVESIVPDGLKALQSYDTKKGTKLLNTLFVYLNNEGNITKTAKELFIHRHTCLYQLERIQSIAQVDLEDADTRLKLRIVFSAIKYEQGSSLY